MYKQYNLFARIIQAFNHFCLSLSQLRGVFSALSVDMAFKIAVIYQLGENKLFKSRNSARIKSEPVIERLDKPLGRTIYPTRMDGEIVFENVLR